MIPVKKKQHGAIWQDNVTNNKTSSVSSLTLLNICLGE